MILPGNEKWWEGTAGRFGPHPENKIFWKQWLRDYLNYQVLFLLTILDSSFVYPGILVHWCILISSEASQLKIRKKHEFFPFETIGSSTNPPIIIFSFSSIFLIDKNFLRDWFCPFKLLMSKCPNLSVQTFYNHTSLWGWVVRIFGQFTKCCRFFMPSQIMMEIVPTNIIASRLPERWLSAMPTLMSINFWQNSDLERKFSS